MGDARRTKHCRTCQSTYRSSRVDRHQCNDCLREGVTDQRVTPRSRFVRSYDRKHGTINCHPPVTNERPLPVVYSDRPSTVFDPTVDKWSTWVVARSRNKEEGTTTMVKNEQQPSTDLVTMDSILGDQSPAPVDDEPPGPSPTSYVGGKPTFDKDDIAYPRLRLAQQQTQEVIDEEAKAGMFVMTGFSAEARVVAVPLMFAKTRILAVGTGADRRVTCSSPDSVTGYGDPGGDCERCPMNKWTENPNGGKNRPPACNVNYNYVCYLPHYNTMAEVNFKKTGLYTAKMFNTLASIHGFGHFAVELFSNKQQSPNSPVPYYVPMMKVLNDVDPSLLATARLMAGITE